MKTEFLQERPITVSVVDDEEDVRLLLAQLINSNPGLRCLSLHCCAEDALHEIPSRRPAVVVVDIQLPGLSGIECVRRLKSHLPGVLILMLTGHDDSDTLFDALRAGANGYLVKQDGIGKVPEAVLELARGGTPLGQGVACRLVNFFHQIGPLAPVMDSLTQREKEIMEHLVKGLSNKEIAAALYIDTGTVHAHLSHIFEKLRVNNRTAAALKFASLRPLRIQE
ncbi:MAG: response regulator transcription factor [Chloroflexi bacterium]|nr:response regulator transcription factor [Chloroflexota bacterium]